MVSHLDIVARVFDLAAPEPNSGCFIFLGLLDRQGYGRLCIGGKEYRAHRVALESRIGPMPKELMPDHKCRVTCCVNPDHLEAVTNRENVLRGTSFAAVNARKTSCIHGHELAGDNLYIMPNGWRACRTCRNAAGRKSKRRHRILLRSGGA